MLVFSHIPRIFQLEDIIDLSYSFRVFVIRILSRNWTYACVDSFIKELKLYRHTIKYYMRVKSPDSKYIACIYQQLCRQTYQEYDNMNGLFYGHVRALIQNMAVYSSYILLFIFFQKQIHQMEVSLTRTYSTFINTSPTSRRTKSSDARASHSAFTLLLT